MHDVTSYSNTNKNVSTMTINSVSIPAAIMMAFATINNNIYICKTTDAKQMVWLGPLKKTVPLPHIFMTKTEG